MPSRNELSFCARPPLETFISDDADLLKLQEQEQAAEYVREAKRRDLSEPNELVSAVVDAVARFYFGHVIRKQQRHASKSQE